MGGLFLEPDSEPPEEERPFPVREGCSVAPLIQAVDMFPELERLVLEAKRTLHFGFRIFDPTTKTRSAEARSQGLDDWTALLRDAVQRGVEFRLLLTDFEPIMAHELHAASWRTFHTLRAMAETLPEERRHHVQILVIQHEGEMGWGWRQLVRLALRARIQKLLDDLHDQGGDLKEALHARPGLWRRYRLDGNGRAHHRPGPAPRLWPATYHQKFAVVDGTTAILGGLDIDERRWDDRRHAKRADRTWHDVSVRLDGPAVGDCATHFQRLWNREMPRFQETVREWTDGCELSLTVEPLHDVDVPSPPPPLPGSRARVQVLRTLSRRNPSPLAMGPRTRVRELLEGHRRLIESAEELIYIETQFFRYRPAARWIAERAAQQPRLQVILVIPNAPEEVAFMGEHHAAHRHGEWLQARALEQLRRRLSERVGIFALAKPQRANEQERAFTADRGAAFGSGVVHVHSKVLIVDDRAALVSSANMNGRSFKWDTELGILWEEPPGVRSFRERLWSCVLPERTEMTIEGASERWRAIANANILSPPESRRALIVPHQFKRMQRFGRPSWFVPDDLV